MRAFLFSSLVCLAACGGATSAAQDRSDASAPPPGSAPPPPNTTPIGPYPRCTDDEIKSYGQFCKTADGADGACVQSGDGYACVRLCFDAQHTCPTDYSCVNVYGKNGGDLCMRDCDPAAAGVCGPTTCERAWMHYGGTDPRNVCYISP